MSIVVPYNSELEVANGAFITPLGDFLMVDGDHEGFAKQYCMGDDFNVLTGAVLGPPRSKIPELMTHEEMLAQKQEVDIFSSSHLQLQELRTLKGWLKKHKDIRKNAYTDFLVFMLSYDKVENQISRMITTASLEPHIRFYNYYLMDWTIDAKERLHYNPETDDFEIRRVDVLLTPEEDREAEAELKEIKANVPVLERPYFFK